MTAARGWFIDANTPPRGDADAALHLDAIDFDYEPFPIGVAQNVFDAASYAEMVESFPTIDDFVAKDSVGMKYSLSQINNRGAYLRFIRRLQRDIGISTKPHRQSPFDCQSLPRRLSGVANRVNTRWAIPHVVQSRV